MFGAPGLGFSEIVILAVLALLVVGPKDLPLMLRKLGRFAARARAMANEFRAGFDELARQAELDELKREVEALRRGADLRSIASEFTAPPDLSPISPKPLPGQTAPPAAEPGAALDAEAAPGPEPLPEPLPEPEALRAGGGRP